MRSRQEDFCFALLSQRGLDEMAPPPDLKVPARDFFNGLVNGAERNETTKRETSTPTRKCKDENFLRSDSQERR
jgi:hypothetical protein